MFSARGDTRGALLRVAHSTLYASTGGGVEPPTWANDQRPGTLEEDGVKYLPPDSAKPRALECFRALFSYVPSTPVKACHRACRVLSPGLLRGADAALAYAADRPRGSLRSLVADGFPTGSRGL